MAKTRKCKKCRTIKETSDFYPNCRSCIDCIGNDFQNFSQFATAWDIDLTPDKNRNIINQKSKNDRNLYDCGLQVKTNEVLKSTFYAVIRQKYPNVLPDTIVNQLIQKWVKTELEDIELTGL